MDISKRFENGLKKYNLNIDDLNKFYYIGGEIGIHNKYYKLFTNNAPLLTHTDKCICGHKIKNNCYISNGDIILIIGESCINRFLPTKKKRICSECFCPHRNRLSTNKCNICKMKSKFIKGEYKINF